jgi:uncharacterized protein YbjT (DUF2867 family)
MRNLVTGATGYIGGRLVQRLVDGGHQVRPGPRPRPIAGRDRAGRVELAVKMLRPWLGAAPRRDAAYYLAPDGPDAISRARPRAAHNFVAAAAGIGRVIYLGGLVPAGERISPHLASRAEVGEILRAGMPTLEFRAGPVIGSGSASFEMVRYLTERLPAMIAPRWILNEVQPIAVRDVLSYLMLSLERGEPGVYSVGGEPLSFKAMMEEFARARGLRRLIVPVPVLAPKLAALWVGLVTPIPNRLAVPLIEGVVHPVVADTSAARGTYPEVEPMPYPEAVRRALRTVEAGGVQTRWSGALGGSAYFELAEVEGLIRETRRTWTPACESVFSRCRHRRRPHIVPNWAAPARRSTGSPEA